MILPVWLIAILIICALIASYVWYMSCRHGEIRKLGFVGPKPRLVLGNITSEGLIQQQMRLYKEYKDEKVIGAYFTRTPFLIVKDLDLIKDITIKYFNCFTNRQENPKSGTDLDYVMTNLKGDQWKHVRSTVSPTFSSGKLKLMCKHVETTSKVLVENLTEKIEEIEPVELKEVFSCYAMDVISSAGFGMELNSVKDPENMFVVEAKKLFNNFGQVFAFLMFAPFLMPIIRLLGIPLLDLKALKSLANFVDQAMHSRREEKKQSHRKDLIQLLVNAQDEDILEHDGTSKEEQEILRVNSSHRKGLTNDEIHGQGLILLLAGYETVSTVLSFTLFLFAVHPEILKKVQEELDKKVDGAAPNYDNVQSLSYMDMCLNEAMRLYPPGFLLDRSCNQAVKIQGIKFPKDYLIFIPVICIHRDPDIWPDPETFDPERFTPENKAGRHPMAHMPFGNGPRNCVGMRLALLELKVALAAILQSLVPVPCEKTVYPVKLEKFRLVSEDGLWVRMEKRK